jgi:predicted HicB family RNase H-like nuclease
MEPQTPEELLKKTVNEIKDFKDFHSKKVEESNDEEAKEPSHRLFHEISETTIKILQDPIMNQYFAEIAKELKEETVQQIVTVIAVCMTHSAYQAITFYDDLLKTELTKQFDNINHHINLSKADIEGIKAAFAILRKSQDEISKEIKINNFQKDNNIPNDN